MSAKRARIVAPMLALLALLATIGFFVAGRYGRDVRNDRAEVASVPPAPSAESGKAGPGERAEPAGDGSRGRGAPAVPSDALAVDGPAAAKALPAPEVAPSFDVVRVEPNGDSVIAGRAAPGATVDLLRNGRSVARVFADSSGLFAVVPPALAPGTHDLVLSTISPDGMRARSVQSVTVVVAASRDQPPLVTVTAPDQPTVVLSRPDELGPAGPRSAGGAVPDSPASRPEIRIASVEAQAGQLFVSGIAAPGATIRLYLNDALVAPGSTAADGRLTFTIGKGVRPGDYTVRLDDVDPVTGNVRSRAEVPFTVPPPAAVAESAPAGQGAQSGGKDVSAGSSAESRAGVPGRARLASTPKADGSTAQAVGDGGGPAQVIVPEVNTAMVARGDNLWRISKRVYGEGLRYTVIFGANSPQIRNPNLIYPGQVFVVPSQPPQDARR